MAFNPNSYEHIYGFDLFDTIHNFFPEMIYDEDIFTSETENWVRYRMNRYFPTVFPRQQNIYRIYRSSAIRDDFNNWRLENIIVEPSNRSRPRTNYSYSYTRQPLRTTRPQQVSRTVRTSDLAPENLLISLLGNTFATRFTDEELQSSNIFADVLVAPTTQQIDDASRILDHSAIPQETECAVCQDHGSEPRAWRVLNCQHSFHKHCIDQWFRQNVHCPVCRADIRERMPTRNVRQVNQPNA